MYQICLPPSHQSHKAPIHYLSADIAYTDAQSLLACHHYSSLYMYILLNEYHSELGDFVFRWQLISGIERLGATEGSKNYSFICTERSIMQAIEEAIHKQYDVYLFDSHKECMKFVYETLHTYYTTHDNPEIEYHTS